MAKKTCKQREDLRKTFSSDEDTAGMEHLSVMKDKSRKLVIIVTFNKTKKRAMENVVSSKGNTAFKVEYMTLAQLEHYVNDLGWKWFYSS